MDNILIIIYKASTIILIVNKVKSLRKLIKVIYSLFKIFSSNIKVIKIKRVLQASKYIYKTRPMVLLKKTRHSQIKIV